MQSLPESITQIQPLEQSIDRVFKFSELIEQIEKILFVEPIALDSSLSPQEPKYFFFKCDSLVELRNP